MRAVHLIELVGPAGLRLVEVPEPAAPSSSVVIDVHAAGVSFPELLQTRGLYQQTYDLPAVLGSEVAGVVRSAPADGAFHAGDRVAAMSDTGGYQETVAVSADHVFPLPGNVSFEAGAALPMNYLTSVYALTRRGRLAAGETVLVHGAGGGIGTASVQLAKALGATVIAVTSSADKADAAARAGADHVVDTATFRADTAALTGGQGVHIVVDPVGGEVFLDSLRSLTPGGRHLVIGFTSGEIPVVKVNRLLLRDIDVVGVGFGRQDVSYQQLWAEMFAHMESGALDPVIADVLPLERVADALTMLDERRVAGKIVLRVR
jgi:NADPH2:quinone reductase